VDEQDKKQSVWAPLSPVNLALAAASEVGISAAGEALGVPQGAGLIFSTIAGASVEVAGNVFAEAKRILRTANTNRLSNPLPETVKRELSAEKVAAAVQLIESNEARMTRLIYERATKNVGGLRPGVSLVHLA
jgi:3-polyprenyl-4-hydroxybenzoate decarboxylase